MLDLPLISRRSWLRDCIASTTSSIAQMIVKSESPPSARTESFHLSFLDQNVVRVYTQTLSIFPVSRLVYRLALYALLTRLASFRTRMRQKLQSRH
jgi:hypothetical protein